MRANFAAFHAAATQSAQKARRLLGAAAAGADVAGAEEEEAAAPAGAAEPPTQATTGDKGSRSGEGRAAAAAERHELLANVDACVARFADLAARAAALEPRCQELADDALRRAGAALATYLQQQLGWVSACRAAAQLFAAPAAQQAASQLGGGIGAGGHGGGFGGVGGIAGAYSRDAPPLQLPSDDRWGGAHLRPGWRPPGWQHQPDPPAPPPLAPFLAAQQAALAPAPAAPAGQPVPHAAAPPAEPASPATEQLRKHREHAAAQPLRFQGALQQGEPAVERQRSPAPRAAPPSLPRAPSPTPPSPLSTRSSLVIREQLAPRRNLLPAGMVPASGPGGPPVPTGPAGDVPSGDQPAKPAAATHPASKAAGPAQGSTENRCARGCAVWWPACSMQHAQGRTRGCPPPPPHLMFSAHVVHLGPGAESCSMCYSSQSLPPAGHPTTATTATTGGPAALAQLAVLRSHRCTPGNGPPSRPAPQPASPLTWQRTQRPVRVARRPAGRRSGLCSSRALRATPTVPPPSRA